MGMQNTCFGLVPDLDTKLPLVRAQYYSTYLCCTTQFKRDKKSLPQQWICQGREGVVYIKLKK